MTQVFDIHHNHLGFRIGVQIMKQGQFINICLVTDRNEFAALALLFVVIGHIWPAPLHWRGGKGVVTSGGAMLVLITG